MSSGRPIRTSASQAQLQDFEEILEHLGGFGRFQVLVLGLILIFEIPTAFVLYLQTFTGRIPPEWNCNPELVDNLGSSACTGKLSDPLNSFVAEWNLIGNLSWVPDFITTVQMGAMLIGNVLSCQAADWYGRRWTTFITLLILAVASAVSAQAPNPYVYVVARFFCGCAFSGYLSLGAVYSMEFMTTKWRMLGCSCGPLGIGSIFLTFLAYYIQSWRVLTWVTTAPLFLIFVLFPFIPESPRWLLQKGKVPELVSVLCYIAKINGAPPIDVAAVEYLVRTHSPAATPAAKGTPTAERLNYTVFFRGSGDLRLKSICMLVIFFAWSVIFFGLSFNIKNMEGDLYWNVFYFGVSEAIGLPSALFILNSIGRRASVILSMFLASFFLVALAILQLTIDSSQYPELVLIMALLAKYGISLARSATKALSNESFPTSIRSMGAGLCGVSTALGGIACSQLASAGASNPSIPFFAFAIIGVTGSLFALMIPETSGKPLQESMRPRTLMQSVIHRINSTISMTIRASHRARGSKRQAGQPREIIKVPSAKEIKTHDSLAVGAYRADGSKRDIIKVPSNKEIKQDSVLMKIDE